MKTKLSIAIGLMVAALLVAIVARRHPGSSGNPPPPVVTEMPAPPVTPPVENPFTTDLALSHHPEADSEKARSIFGTQGAAAALAFAKTLEGKLREDAVLHIMTRAAMEGNHGFVTRELADSGLDETHMGFVISPLMSAWPDPVAAIEWAQRELKGAMQRSAVSTAVQKLGRENPQAGVSILEELPSGEARDEAFSNLISGWGGHDIQAALDYAQTSGGRSDFASALSSLSEKWVEQDPENARLYLENTQQDEKSSRLAHFLVLAKMKDDPASTLTWAGSLDGIAGERAKRSAVVAWADEDLEAATRFITAAEPSLRQQFTPILANVWTKQDPSAAGDWARTLPATELDHVITPLIYQWFELDASAAAAWLSTLPESPAKQHGGQILADRIAKKNGDNHLSPVTSEISTLMLSDMDDGMLFQKPLICR